MGWPAVQGYQDGVDRVDAQTLNRPLSQLAERTEYLRRLVDAADHQKVVASDVELYPASGDGKPAPGQPVYRVPANGTYALAAAAVGENRWFYADDPAMAVGIVGADGSAVVLYGYVGFQGGIDAGTVIVDKNPASGRYFLSATPGKLTAKPTGPVIYVCDCQIAGGKVVSMIVSPQYRDTGESHVHRAFVVSGAPMGGYSVSSGGRYHAPGILPQGVAKDTGSLPGIALVPRGYWAYAGSVEYTVSVGSDGRVSWTSGGLDGASTSPVAVADDGTVAVGSHGLRVSFTSTGSPNGKTWTVNMPDDARAWVDDGTTGYRLNLGMYPELMAYVPDNGVAMPVNGASLTVDGVDRPGPAFGGRKGWSIEQADGYGGPWLVWYDREVRVAGDVSATAPFIWDAVVGNQRSRDLVLYLNRMRVGPTGFVTSLQAAPGSPLRVTSVQTGATAMQGALMLGLDVDFKSAEGNAEGSQVVKRIEGNTFITGQVVERIVAGPGIAVDHQQGTVTVSASNAVYAGDFETIALRNAKQDLAGGVFPYVKLLGWQVGGQNTDSGFTARFRVPDFVPYADYRVVVSASVFGEAPYPSNGDAFAGFRLVPYVLADAACVPEATAAAGSIALPAEGDAQVVSVRFSSGYGAFDPVLVHGFGSAALADATGRQAVDALLLKDSGGEPITVKPGYFVGLKIERCAPGSGTAYTAPLGFLSLRWNLVAAATAVTGG